MHTVTLITGGSRSGKSAHALEISRQYNRKTFLATAEPLDDEMRDRIERHKKERSRDFENIEEPIEIVEAIREASADTDLILLDCLTVWLGNLSYHLNDAVSEEKHIAGLLELLKSPTCDIILVTNEVGMGIVPESSEARSFRDSAGRLNQQIAAVADRVILVVSGIPMVIKGQS